MLQQSFGKEVDFLNQIAATASMMQTDNILILKLRILSVF